MADLNHSQNLPAAIRFIAYHRPALSDGIYSVEATPSLQIRGSEKIQAGQQTKRFQISGTRFKLRPDEILSVFPPVGSLADHSNVLPHIILNRSTVPWERSIGNLETSIPWLALLVFDEQTGIPSTQVLSLAQVKAQSTSKHFPNPTLEIGQEETDQVLVIDVKKSVLEVILPSPTDVSLLAHVRQGVDDQGALEGAEHAVIIANRLPQKEGRSQVHLVSLEGRYTNQGFNFMGAGAEDTIRLVSLHNWSFANVNADQSLPGILKRLNVDSGLSEDHMLRLKDIPGEASLNQFLSTGFVPLEHHLRTGGSTVSWYHGPLATGNNPNSVYQLPAMTSDALLRFDVSTGFLDVSYASAWELGRLLILQHKSVSSSLYAWKRQQAQKRKNDLAQAAFAHLPLDQSTEPESPSIPIPEGVKQWFQDLSLLKGIPFDYLVADPDMLPIETLRFFVIDKEWIACLLDGAFSLGRVHSGDHEQDRRHAKETPDQHPAAISQEQMSGFLIRSEAVSGWPDLHIEAFHKTDEGREKKRVLRKEKLSDNVVLYLYEGMIDEVDMFQKAESVHFGLDRSDSGYHKNLKNRQGINTDNKNISPIPFRNSGKIAGVINMNELATQIKNAMGWAGIDAALFAIEMTEGVEKIRFRK